MAESLAAAMPGAFGPGTTHNLLSWVLDWGHAGEEPFRKCHTRMLENHAE